MTIPMRHLLPALLLLAPLAAFAQQDERLPDLTPREFEIRGELQVSLPDLQRQPLRGFAPPPRTYVVPADRQPHVGTYAQRMDDLPADPLAAPVAPSLLRAQARVGQIDLLAGRYLARRGRLSLNTGGFGLDATYSGHSEYQPFASLPGQAGTDDFSGRMTLSGGDVLRYSVAADGAYHEFSLLEEFLEPGGFARRTTGSLGGDARLASTAAPGMVPFSVTTRFESNRVRDAGRIGDPFITVAQYEPRESRFVLSGDVEAGTVQLDAGVEFSGFSLGGAAATEDDPSTTAYRAGAAFGFPLGDARLAIGGRVLGYGSSLDGEDGVFAVGPIVNFETTVAPTVRLFLVNDPNLGSRSLLDLYRQNPFALLNSRPLPDVNPVDAQIGIELQSSAVRLTASGGGLYSSSSLYFQRPCPGCFETGPLYEARYAGIMAFRAGGDLTFFAPGNISVSLGGDLRTTRFTSDAPDGSIRPDEVPYVSPLVGRASVAVPFAQEAGLLQATFFAEGARPTETAGQDAPGWASLSVEAHYRFAGRFGLLVRGDNLAGRAERWPGYPRPPAILTAGVRAGW